MKAATLVRLASGRGDHCTGRCPLCGHRTVFLQLHEGSFREGLTCVRCRSFSRKRHVALVIRDLLQPDARTAAEAITRVGCRALSAQTGDRLGHALRDYERYWTSEFVPGVSQGEQIGPRSTCQDLEQLTYDDASFDLLITEDVLEHVRHEERAFAEIHRVLAPGGRHVFTIPYRVDAPTLVRVDTSGAQDVHLLPPEYHGDAIRGQILAYRTFGYDLLDQLAGLGFTTSIHLSGRREARYGIFDSLVLVSHKASP